MRRNLTTWSPLLILVALGALAGLGKFVESARDADDAGFPREIAVTSSLDRGPGSLRTALFMAMRAPHPVTIRIEAPRIDVEVPLPPVVARHGLTVAGDSRDETLLRRTGQVDEPVPLLDIVAEDVALRDFALDAGGGIGIEVRGARTDIAGIGIRNASFGILGTDVDGLSVRDSVFSASDYGVRLGGESAVVALTDNEFRDHRSSAVWIVMAGEPLAGINEVRVAGNRFVGGRDGLVAANVVIDVRGNRAEGFAGSGFMLLDAQATVSDNRLIGSRGVGMQLRQLRNSNVAGNEIARHEQVGLLIVDADGLQVSDNEVYNNGYGIVAVGLQPISATLRNNSVIGQTIDGLITIGATPLLDGNHALRNRQAGIRILDLLYPDARIVEAVPRLANNVLSDNGFDDVLYGEYRVEAP